MAGVPGTLRQRWHVKPSHYPRGLIRKRPYGRRAAGTTTQLNALFGTHKDHGDQGSTARNLSTASWCVLRRGAAARPRPVLQRSNYEAAPAISLDTLTPRSKT